MAQPDSLLAKDRPIAFTLHNTNAGGGEPLILPLVVRPEDLSITYPSRLAVTQTFGEDGAWADGFGQGVKTIQLSGVTGWRGARTDSGGDDGFQHFQKLHKTVFTEWHKLRADVTKAGDDPDKVLLILSDGLDKLNWVVAPQQFVLKRNRSRPLLAQYNISLMRLREDTSEHPPKPMSADQKKVEAIKSLSESVRQIEAFAKDFKKSVSTLLAPIKAAISAFVAMVAGIAKSVISAIKAVVGTVRGVVDEVVGLARGIAQAGMNIALTIAAITTLPQQLMAQFRELGSAFSNMVCVFSNVFRKRTFLPDYDVDGTGNCASTSGGSAISPYVTSNTFESVLVSEKAKITVTRDASTAATNVINSDPVLNPMSIKSIGVNASVMAGGFGVVAA